MIEPLEHRLVLSINPYITEFMASNAASLADADGDYPDWIEIYNPNSTSLNIGGMYLTDNLSKLTKYQIATGTTIAANGYIVIFCDDGDTHNSTDPDPVQHTNFKLDAAGEYLALVDTNGTTILSQYGTVGNPFPAQTTDVSYGLTNYSSFLSNTFDSDASGFTYADNTLGGGQASDSRINGAYASSGGYAGGCLAIVDSKMATSRYVNGGFSKTVTIGLDGTYVFSSELRILLTSVSSAVLATSQYGEIHLLIKNSGGTTVADSILLSKAGDGVSKTTLDTGWVLSSASQALTTGTYTITLGLKNAKLTVDSNNTISAWFDNFTIKQFSETPVCQYLYNPTPGVGNDSGLLGTVEEVKFSVEHGFYANAFSLKMSCNDPYASIYYTVNGSTPSASNGTLYTGAITVSKTTVLRAVAVKNGYADSAPTTQSYIFLADVVTQSSSGSAPAGWPSAGMHYYDDTYYDNYMNRYYDYGMDPSVVSTYGSAAVIASLSSVPTISITTDVANLFDPQSGIILNSNQDLEISASVEYLTTDGTDGFTTSAGVKIRGSASTEDSNITKYGLRLSFDDDLEYNFFGDDAASIFDKLDLRVNQNWSWSKDADTNATMIRDTFSRETQLDIGDVSTHGQVIMVYIDGQFWGVYEIEERIDAQFASTYLGGDKEDYDVIKVNRDGWIQNPITSTWSIEYTMEASDGTMNAYTDLYNQTTGQFTVNYVVPTAAVTTLASAEGVLSDADQQYYVLTGSATSINYTNAGTGGHYASSAAFPGLDTTTDVDNFIVEVQGTIRIATTGNWTFGVSTSESFNFELTNGTNTYSFTYTGTGTVADVLHTFNIAAGDYNIRIVYVETTGGADLEVFAAQGTYTTFNSTAFDLIGDTANGGLALPGMASNVAYQRVQGLNLDGTRNTNYDKLLDAKNLIDYMLVIYYTANYDAPISGWIWDNVLVNGTWTWYPYVQPNNFFAVYNRVDQDGFKFIVHDSEHTLNCGVSWGTSGENLLKYSYPAYSAGTFPDGILDANPYQFFYKLTSNSEFLLAIADRLQELTTGDGALTDTACLARYDELTDVYENVLIAEEARWADHMNTIDSSNDIPTLSDWNTAVAAERLLMTTRTETFVNLVRSYKSAYYSSTYIAPSASVAEGTVDANTIVTLSEVSTSADGTIYYTLDGTDPRAFGGTVSSTAIKYAATMPITVTQSTDILARVLYTNGTWSPLLDNKYYVNATPTSENIAITEINYNPYNPTTAEIAAGYDEANDFEFIEIQNVGTTKVDISQLKMTLGTYGTIAFADGVSTDKQYLNPGEYAVIVANPAAFAMRYGSAVAVIGKFTGSLSNGGEKITIINHLRQVVASVDYSDSGNWPGRADGKGSTLQIIDPYGDPDDGDNWRASIEYGGTPGAEGLLSYDGVVINEILSHTDDSSGDKIELYNTTGSAIDVSGWYLSDDGGNYHKYQIPEGTIIAAHGYLTFNETQFGMSPYALATFPGDGDASVVNSDVDETTTVRALDLSKSTFRKLAFDYTVTANTTLQLEFYCDTTGAIQGIGLDTDDAASAASFFQLAGTTTWGNQAYRTSTTGSWVTVTINLSGLAGMNAKYLVFGNSGSDTTECLFRNVKLVETGGATTAVDFDKYFAFDAFKGDELYLVETDSAGNFTKFADHVDFGAAENGVSFGRWPSGSGTLFPMTSNTFGSTNSGPTTGSVVISEIYYDPTGGNDLEYIELYNNSSAAVSLANWSLGGAISYDFASGASIAAYSTLVIASDAGALKVAYPSLTIAGSYSGHLSNGGETVNLYKASDPDASDPDFYPQILIDQVRYDDATPWPVIAAGTNYSIQRISATVWGNTASNWYAAATTPGSTPFVANNDTAVAISGKAQTIAVLANDASLVNGINATTVLITTVPSHGTASVNATTGAITYTPTSGYTGTDTIAYKVKNGLGTYSSIATVTVTVKAAASVTGRKIFYNNSSYDGNSWAANASDDAAIVTAKSALLPGGTATSANYTTYSKGINGIMIDVSNLGTTDITLDNLSDYLGFKVGTTGSVWTTAPMPVGVAVRLLSGTTYRITLVWEDGAIVNEWLQVTLKANVNSGVGTADVFYFGNLVGDANASATTDSTDAALVRTNRTGFGTTGITSAYDLNRDGRVNAADEAIAIAAGGATLTLISAPASAPEEEIAAAPAETASVTEELVVVTSLTVSADASAVAAETTAAASVKTASATFALTGVAEEIAPVAPARLLWTSHQTSPHATMTTFAIPATSLLPSTSLPAANSVTTASVPTPDPKPARQARDAVFAASLNETTLDDRSDWNWLAEHSHQKIRKPEPVKSVVDWSGGFDLDS